MSALPETSEVTSTQVSSIKTLSFSTRERQGTYVRQINIFNNKVSRLGSDTAVIQEGLSTNVSMFLRSVIFILVSIVFVFIISWQLTLVMIGSILPVIIFSVYYGKVMKVA